MLYVKQKPIEVDHNNIKLRIQYTHVLCMHKTALLIELGILYFDFYITRTIQTGDAKIKNDIHSNVSGINTAEVMRRAI
jgi:hypothetical protein